MADPVVVACPANQWTKVASSVTTGQIHVMSKDPNIYLQTYRDAGEVAPTDKSDAVPAFVAGCPATISSLAGIDIYIFPVGAAGSVRVDL